MLTKDIADAVERPVPPPFPGLWVLYEHAPGIWYVGQLVESVDDPALPVVRVIGPGRMGLFAYDPRRLMVYHPSAADRARFRAADAFEGADA
jgi:hypothetical protein